jgi:hypothetical protein
MAAPETLAAAMEAINTLAVWLVEAGLDSSAIAQWKFNALAKKFPDLAEIIEDAKKLIGSSTPVPEVGMTVSEVAQRLTEELERQIKPVEVNQAFVELGFQVRPDNGKRIWQLTEVGKEYGFSRLATSKTNDWSGPQVTWQSSVMPILLDYFEITTDALPQTDENRPASLGVPMSNESKPAPAPESEQNQKNWLLSDRLKVLKKKVTAQQRLHIEMEAAEAFKQRHGKPPAKEQLKGKYYDVYPAGDLDLMDDAIKRVLERYAKSH